MSFPTRTAFFVSDRTGITAEMFGNSLLSQFDKVQFNRVTLPFLDSAAKIEDAVAQISAQGRLDGVRPLVFSTVVDEGLRTTLATADAFCMDFFGAFIGPLEQELAVKSSHTVGRTHGIIDFNAYKLRIDAVNFSMSHDDGIQIKDLEEADIVLVGVSRSGKTPTCLYLALQFGIRAANYPLLPEDLEERMLPKILRPFRHKLYGLTISAERLSQIRHERRANSRYASLENCRYELGLAQTLFRQESISYLDTTNKSVEELATTILHQAGLKRRIF